jgi:hypothetical protein
MEYVAVLVPYPNPIPLKGVKLDFIRDRRRIRTDTEKSGT